MRIKVINPNTTQSMTESIGAAARAAAAPGTEILAVSPVMGPASIEDHYDEAFAAIGVLDEVLKGEVEASTATSSPASAIRACSRRASLPRGPWSGSRRPRCTSRA